jgi:cell wall-associated NlpC family hydrolase
VRHFRHFFLIGLISLTVLTGLVGAGAVARGPVAGAAPIDDKRAEAAAIQDQIDANGQRISALAEEFNGAQLRLDEAERAIADAQARIEAARAEVARIQHLIELRAASVYRRAVRGESLDGMDYDDARDLLTRRHYASKQASHDDTLLVQLEKAQRVLAAQKTEAEAAREAATAEQQRIEATRSDLEAANAEQQRILEQVNGELEALVQEEARQRELAEAARAATRYGGGGNSGGGGSGGSGSGGSGSGDGNPASFPDLPAPGQAAAIAIDFARAQLGKPYVYAATGPDAYDCSGLTMTAYAAAGISLPHYSGAQYSKLPKVSLDAMLPGDLVFWGAGGGSHVGIYIGDGLMIHAPHTGDVVKIAAVYGTPVGAARPAV